MYVINFLIVINWLMLSGSLCPKVITLSGIRCIINVTNKTFPFFLLKRISTCSQELYIFFKVFFFNICFLVFQLMLYLQSYPYFFSLYSKFNFCFYFCSSFLKCPSMLSGIFYFCDILKIYHFLYY
jgi:hypothetical protein